MSKDKKWKWVDWDKPVTVLNLIAIFALGVFVLTRSGDQSSKLSSSKLSPPKSPGCFDFNDGTTQGWTLEQLYIAKPAPPPGQQHKKVPSALPKPAGGYYSYSPFALANHNNIALESQASHYLIADKNVQLCDFFFESPDLSNKTEWQNLAGYCLDVRREFFSPCFDPPDTCFAQLQVRLIEKATKKPKIFSETENVGGSDQPKFHEIKLNTPYHFDWKDAVFSDPKYTVKQIRIRCTVPGYISMGECAFRGSWKIGNVCPAK
jgi:hypothetical protein